MADVPGRRFRDGPNLRRARFTPPGGVLRDSGSAGMYRMRSVELNAVPGKCFSGKAKNCGDIGVCPSVVGSERQNRASAASTLGKLEFCLDHVDLSGLADRSSLEGRRSERNAIEGDRDRTRARDAIGRFCRPSRMPGQQNGIRLQ